MSTPPTDTGSTPVPAPRQRHGRGTKTRADEVRDIAFPVTLRGYERTAVDAYVAKVADLVAELEATQLRETVVQRALDEVGEQTSSILQQAHDTADEISSRSRAQAEGRLQRAEREAETMRREADEYARRIADDTRELWEDRSRLIEDLRRYAEEVLGLADDALERLEPPLPAAPEPATEEPAAAAEAEPAELAEPVAWDAPDEQEGDTAEVEAQVEPELEAEPDEPSERDSDATVEFRVPGREPS